MKHAILNVLVALIFTVAIMLMQFSFLHKYNALGGDVRNYLIKSEKKISQLEQEVRLIKTDLYIAQNGYEEDYAE